MGAGTRFEKETAFTDAPAGEHAERHESAQLLRAWLLGMLVLGGLALALQLCLVPHFGATALGIAPVFGLLALAYACACTARLQWALAMAVLVPPLGALLAIRANVDDVMALAFPPLAVLIAAGSMSARSTVEVAGVSLASILVAPLVQPALPASTVIAAAAFDVIGSALVLLHVGHRVRLESERARRWTEAGPRLREQDRLARIGTLAAATAHELVNALTIASMSVHALERDLVAAGQAQGPSPNLSDIREGLMRMEVIVRGLRGLSRDDGGQESADVNEVVHTALRLAHAQVMERALVELDLSEVPAARGHRVRLGQVMLNLLVNALQALPPGRDGNRVRVTTRSAAAGWVEIIVEDNGSGIAAETLPRIFDPFFTTKPASEGTGLGLHVCQEIVEGYGGSMFAESRPGEHTRMHVLLPPAR